MKFIRYGDLKAFRQKQHEKCPKVSEYPHAPPRRKGFFALRRAEPQAYGKQRALRNNATASRYGGPYCYNATLAIEGMYEVFFDEEDIKKIT